MEIYTYPLGDLQANCYVLVNEDTREAVAIDVGATPQFLALEELKHNYKIKEVLLTHCHFDHVGGASYFVNRGATCKIGKTELSNLKNSAVNLSCMFGEEIQDFEVETVQDGQVFTTCGLTFEVIETPGHTSGSVCYKIDKNIFTGDLLFNGSFGRYDFPTGNVKELIKSIKKVFKFENLTVYSGHGEKTDIQTERLYNPIRSYFD